MATQHEEGYHLSAVTAPTEQEQKLFQRRQLYGLMFFLGTILAVIGWFIEFKGWDEVSIKFAKLTILATVGHLIQVLGAFGYLVTPDAVIEDTTSKLETEAVDRKNERLQ